MNPSHVKMNQYVQEVVPAPSSRWARWVWLSGSFLLALPILIYIFARPLGLDKYLEQLPWLKVENVEIYASAPLTPDRIRGWLPSFQGKSILGISGGAIVDLLETKPWVDEVSFKKEFPSRVIITVTAKAPAALATYDGQTGFIDDKGRWIEKVDNKILKAYDLVTIHFDRTTNRNFWKMDRVVEGLNGMREKLGKGNEISQIALGSFPNLRVFLVTPKVELIMTFDQWSDQIEKFLRLIKNPPQPLSTMRRINLTLPKKAVVSSYLSH